MSTDRLTDSLDRPWAPGTLLGRGTWGRSRIVRDPQGREAVLKEPLTEADFPADAPLPHELIATCRAAARQQAELLGGANRAHLPRLEATIDLGSGRTGLILPRYATLQQRLVSGMPLGDALKLVFRVASALTDTGAIHGNIRPTNIVFGERNEPFLADWATPALAPHHLRLLELAGGRRWLPPEARSQPSVVWDTWALCQILHAAVLVEPTAEDRAVVLPLADGGLDKVALATLKDAAHAKLEREGTNPRFRARVTDRLGALLSRGLSSSYEPSPPYRFNTARDLAERVQEILALLRPRVVEVGRILLPAHAHDGVFHGGSDLSFTVTVGCTQGIADHEDIVCGLQLRDLDATGDGRMPVDDTRLEVQVHPSGRLRFQLALPGVPPGRYQVRVAFAVKDSGDDPAVAEGRFSVRPPPGYVPPQPEPEPAALPFPRGTSDARTGQDPIEDPTPRAGTPAIRAPARSDGPASTPGRTDRGRPGAREPYRAEPTVGTSPGERGTGPFSNPSDPSSGGGEVVLGVFPKPIAPPEDDEPVPSHPAPRPVPAQARSGDGLRAGDLSLDPKHRARIEPATDATMPEPGAWPPPASPIQPAAGGTEPADELLADDTLDDPGPSRSALHALPPAEMEPPPLLRADPPRPRPTVLHAHDPRVAPPRSEDPFSRSSPPLSLRADSDRHRTPSGLSDLAPGRTEDLPEVDITDRREKKDLPAPVVRIVDAIRNDSYFAVGLAVATSLLLVLVISALLKVC